MKLRTSFFNASVLRKNLTRFAPLWALYAVAEVLCLTTVNLNEAGFLADDLTYVMGPVSIFHMGYAFLVAVCLFGDLFDSRLCNGLHAMPMRREGWLLTHLASALLFALIPAAAGGGFACILLGEYYWMALLWQAVSLLQFVFFFGIAVFCVMGTGKRVGMIAVYALLNFLSMLIYWIAKLIYEPLLPGVVLGDDWFNLFSPVVTFVEHTYVDFYYDKILGGFFNGFFTEHWLYLYLCAGIGIVFLLLSWLLYRKRHLETAGDFISFRPMRFFFLIAYTFGAGALVYAFNYLFGAAFQSYPFLAVGIVVGWFTGWMLLERTVKIFTKKTVLGFVVFAAVFAGSMGITYLDPMGITTYIPETENIKAACVYTLNDSYRYELTDDTGGRVHSDPAGIALVQDLHRQMIETPAWDGETVSIKVRYDLTNGIQVYRSYSVPAETETADNLSVYLSNVHSLFSINDYEQVKNTADYIRIYPTVAYSDILEIQDAATIQVVLDAIYADCQAGTMAQHENLHSGVEQVAGVDITWTHVSEDGKARLTRGDYIMVFEDSVNVKALLETLTEKE